MEPSIMALIAAGVAVLFALIWAIATYNRFVGLRQHLKESWSDIDVELKRRYELIPNLVETVKGYASHEREALEAVVKLRNAAQANHGPQAEQAVDESALLIGLKKLFALAEGYPDLKASTNFLALQKQLSLTEDRIAASRRFYNANVRDLNRLRGQFPTSIIGSVFGFEEGSFFELASEAERVVPKIGV